MWQARQDSLDRLVAVKIDHRPLAEDKERRRFLREAGAAGRLSGHAGIVTVHDAGILPDGRPYLVMDLCSGGSLTRWLKPEGRQSQQRVRDVGVRIADALATAHERGVLHRDVKPANILIDSYGHAGLADFGLAAIPEPGVESSVTLEGMTPAYAPQEVFYLKPPTEYGDVYSLAATLYALMDGKPPFWPDSGTPSIPELLERQQEPIERLAGVDDGFMNVLLGALNSRAEERPTAAEFRDQLAALTFAAPAPEARAPAARGATAPPRKRRSLAAILIAAAVVLALVVVGDLWLGPANNAVVAVPGSPVVPAPSSTVQASGEPTSSPSAASPTGTPPPDGFVDCSEQLGGRSFCLVTPECWTELYGYADLMTVGTMQDCSQTHLHQTFAAGVLSSPVNRQSVFEAKKEVQALCNSKTLDKVLALGQSRKDWQISKLAPQVQIEGDDFFRCLFSNGERKTPEKLKIPK